MKLKIWTRSYQPFVLGGKVHGFVGTKIEASAPVAIDKRYKGHLIIAPNGDTLVAESTTGAIIGNSIEQVKKDIEDGDPKVMKDQIAQAKENAKKVTFISEKKFWQQMRKSK